MEKDLEQEVQDQVKEKADSVEVTAKMINIQERMKLGTKENIRSYRQYCLKHDCLSTLPFEAYMNQRLRRFIQ